MSVYCYICRLLLLHVCLLSIFYMNLVLLYVCHIAFKLLHYFITAYLCITHIPETMAGSPASVKGMGELLQLCVSRLRGFVCFFLLRRGEERTNVVL